MPWKIFVQNAFFPAAGSSPPKLSRVGATSKTAAVDEDEEEKENATQCKPGMEGGEECENMKENGARLWMVLVCELSGILYFSV